MTRENKYFSSRISAPRLAIIRTLKKEGALTTSQLRRKLENRFDGRLISRELPNMAISDLLIKTKGEKSYVFSLGPRAQDVLENINEIEVYQLTSNPEKKPAQEKNEEQQLELMPEINISKTANTLADQISTVLAQNQKYRDHLISVRDSINKLLDE